MSYSRFGWGGSNIYTYPAGPPGVRGHIECCACALGDRWQFFELAEVVQHLADHRAAGHCVPDNVEPDIREDFAAGRYGLVP